MRQSAYALVALLALGACKHEIGADDVAGTWTGEFHLVETEFDRLLAMERDLYPNEKEADLRSRVASPGVSLELREDKRFTFRWSEILEGTWSMQGNQVTLRVQTVSGTDIGGIKPPPGQPIRFMDVLLVVSRDGKLAQGGFVSTGQQSIFMSRNDPH